MELPRRARPNRFRQNELFDIPLKGSKALAVLVGDLFNEIVRVTLGGESLTTNGQVYCCPDILLQDDNSVVEVKASERSNYFKLSCHQINKYRNIYNDGIGVYYAFAIYSAGSAFKPIFKHLQTNDDGVRTTKSALKFIAERMQLLLVIDFEILKQFIQRSPFKNEWKSVESKQVPEEHRGFYRLKTKDVSAWHADPIEALTSLQLDIADFVVTRTDVVGLKIGGIEIRRFPYIMISKKVKRDYKIDPNDIDCLRKQAIDMFNKEDKAPF